MAEYRVRFVAENGTSSGDGSSTAPFRLPSQAINNLGTVSGAHVNPGKVVIGEGDFTETATVELSRQIDIEGIGGYGGGIGGTRWIRGHSGAMVTFDSTYTDWSHYYRIANLTMDGNKASFAAEADVLTILKPGFNCKLDRVAFRSASGWGLVIKNGANNFHGYDLSFNGCGTSTGGGALLLQSNSSDSGLGLFCGFWGTQVDASGEFPIYIDSNLGGRHEILFDLPEFESSAAGTHRACIKTNFSGGASNFGTISVRNLVSQSPSSTGTNDVFLEEAGSKPALWMVDGANGDTGDRVFNGVNETVSGKEVGRAVFGNFGGGSSRLRIGENQIISRKSTSGPEGNETGYVGDECLWRSGSAGTSVWYKEVGEGTSTGWVQRST
jgi:hypothetical protein